MTTACPKYRAFLRATPISAHPWPIPAVALPEQHDEEWAAGADFVEAELEGLLAGTLLLGNAPAQVNLDQLDLALAAEAPQLGPGVPKQQATVLRYHATPVHLTAGVQNDELS
jgi:hypothetical protein